MYETSIDNYFGEINRAGKNRPNIERVISLLVELKNKINDENRISGIASETLSILTRNNHYSANDLQRFFNVFRDLNVNINVNIQDSLGNTPLHYALANGNENFALFLIRNGADAKLENNQGFNPFEKKKNKIKNPTLKIYELAVYIYKLRKNREKLIEKQKNLRSKKSIEQNEKAQENNRNTLYNKLTCAIDYLKILSKEDQVRVINTTGVYE